MINNLRNYYTLRESPGLVVTPDGDGRLHTSTQRGGDGEGDGSNASTVYDEGSVNFGTGDGSGYGDDFSAVCKGKADSPCTPRDLDLWFTAYTKVDNVGVVVWSLIQCL